MGSYYSHFDLLSQFQDASRPSQLFVPEFMFDVANNTVYSPRSWLEYIAQQQVLLANGLKQTDPATFKKQIDEQKSRELRIALRQHLPRLAVAGDPRHLNTFRLFERIIADDSLEYRLWEGHKPLASTAGLPQPDYLLTANAAYCYVAKCLFLQINNAEDFVNEACNAGQLPYYLLNRGTLHIKPSISVGRHSNAQMKAFLLDDLNQYIAGLK